jgi:NAD(P)-dependent dehydrogenase (short-subunit alcohol dehydrogenase family)
MPISQGTWLHLKVEGNHTMNPANIQDWFDFTGKVVVITGGAGVLLSPTVLALCRRQAQVVLLGIDRPQSAALLECIGKENLPSSFIQTDVTDRTQVESAAKEILKQYTRVDILINGAGGNRPQATTSPDLPFFDLPHEAVRQVFDLNFMGAFYCCQVFGKIMAQQHSGNILNIVSMNAIRPLTRIPAYSAAKGALANFTQWLAVHMAQEYFPSIRVNAVAPGFFLTQQNRFLLVNEQTQELTARGKRIIDHTPMNRFGDPEDMVGTILWLLSPASGFVSGAVIPVDGGFSAYGGV